MNDFDQQLFNLKNGLPSSRQSKINIIFLLMALPLSAAISKICLRSNLFILILELIVWRVNNLVRATRSKDKAVKLITLSTMLNLAESITAIVVVVKYLIEYIH